MKYNYYWRKSGLKKPYGDNFLSLVEEYKPKNVLEIGVFCGVTSRNICELLKTNFGSDFRYYGLDLFGSTKTSSVDEIEPKFLKNQKFSNPLKTIYYNFIKRENLNSKISVQNFLKKFSQNIELIKGDILETLVPFLNENLGQISFVHIDTDTYTPCLHILKNIKPRLVKGTVILFDELVGYPSFEHHELKALNEVLERSSYEFISFGVSKRKSRFIKAAIQIL